MLLSGCFLVVLLLGGCETINYYSQGIQGHFHLVSQVKPIDEVIDHKDTPADTRKLLKHAKLARAFAIEHLKLPDNQSYLGYADLKRKQVTWTIVATKPLSMEPYQSCFPITGCLSYRGYFREVAAQQFAEHLREEGYETFVGGSTAYSTLGWFKDPIVSPMLRFGEIRLIETLFHELAHQELYIKDDSDFNEAFATTVGQNGAREWLRETDPEALSRYNEYLIRYKRFLNLLGRTSKQLKALYLTESTDEHKVNKKQDIFNKLRQDYQQFKDHNDGYSGFDKWFEKPINNPRLTLVTVYHELVPDFERWLKACNNHYPHFYKTVERIANLPKEQRIETLKQPATCTK